MEEIKLKVWEPMNEEIVKAHGYKMAVILESTNWFFIFKGEELVAVIVDYPPHSAPVLINSKYKLSEILDIFEELYRECMKKQLGDDYSEEEIKKAMEKVKKNTFKLVEV